MKNTKRDASERSGSGSRVAEAIKSLREPLDQLSAHMLDTSDSFSTTEAFQHIAERYAALLEATHEAEKQNEKLAKLVDLLDTPSLKGLVDSRSSDYFKHHTRFFDLISRMYDHSIDIDLHRPSSGIRGVLEDRRNLESYFSSALKEAATFERK